jgi:hypothetical protein
VGGHYAEWLKEVAPGAAQLYGRDQRVDTATQDFDEVWQCAMPARLHYTQLDRDRACAFLDRLSSQGAVLSIRLVPDPHHPFTPPAPWCDLVDPDVVPMPQLRPASWIACRTTSAEAF